jgi:hypothetical protein
MDIEVIIGVVGDFLTCEEIFKFSRVNTIWKSALFFNKKKTIKIIEKSALISHYCGNLCPCTIHSIMPDLEKYYINPEYNLKKLICSKLNGEESPSWLNIILGNDK